jgi:hypothetical protein
MPSVIARKPVRADMRKVARKPQADMRNVIIRRGGG